LDVEGIAAGGIGCGGNQLSIWEKTVKWGVCTKGKDGLHASPEDGPFSGRLGAAVEWLHVAYELFPNKLLIDGCWGRIQ
jgi:hypothetical protein